MGAPERPRARRATTVRGRLLTVVAALLCAGCAGTTTATTEARDRPVTPEVARSHATTTTEAPKTTTTAPQGPPASERKLAVAGKITGGLTPKSVVYAGNGEFFAQNMMYSHTVRVYDRSRALVAEIPDTVDLADFGSPGAHKGSPVEAVPSADGASIYVTNYEMSGAGYTHPGADKCHKGGWDPSYVYRINLASHEVDQIIKVGSVPKFIDATPDGRLLLVTNWCDYDMSVVDVASATEIRRVPLGPYPRGVAVTPDSSAAFVAVMGTSDIARVDLGTFATTWIRNVGRGPRHLVMSPDGSHLYATLNSVNAVAKIDVASMKVVQKVTVGSQPRSMAISADGTALYVVNYAVDRLTKLSTADLSVLQTLNTPHHPIGITYDPDRHDVWVACYSGTLLVLEDR